MRALLDVVSLGHRTVLPMDTETLCLTEADDVPLEQACISFLMEVGPRTQTIIKEPTPWPTRRIGAFLIERYGHTALAAKRCTVSAFLAATLGNLDRAGMVKYHSGPATGRWSYNGTMSYWSLLPTPDRQTRLSWADSGQTIGYVPGAAES